MDGSPPYNFSQRRGRDDGQQTNCNNRQPPESYHPRQNIMSEPSVFHHTYPRQNLDPMPSEQGGSSNRLPMVCRPTSSPNTPLHRHESLPRIRTSAPLHFDYYTRYPSPPPTEAGFPAQSVNPPSFPYPSPSSAHRSIGDQAPNDRRNSINPSPIHHHRHNDEPSASAGNSSMIILPPLSGTSHRPPIHRGADQASNHQHVEMLSSPPRPSITQLPRDNPEQGPLRRHTMDSSQGHQRNGGRRRTLSSLPPPPPTYYPTQLHYPPPCPGTQQQVPPQPGQTNFTSSPPLPLATPHHDNPPTSASLSTSSSHLPQHPQSPVYQPVSPDGPPPISDTVFFEATDIALEPLRVGFENVWAQTVQNVRHSMTNMQKDLTRLVAAERRKNVNLMRCLVNNSEKLKAQEWAAEELRKENNSLMEKTTENEQLARERLTVIDALKKENKYLNRENEEWRKRNEDLKAALARATGLAVQYKEELARVKADAETLRKSREVPSPNDPKPAASSDLPHRLDAETERERIFNDAVKQLRALTYTMEDSPRSNSQNPDNKREPNSEDVVVEPAPTSSNVVHRDYYRRIPPSLEVPTSNQNLLPLSVVTTKVNLTINERLAPPPIQAISTNNGDKSKVDVPDVEMDHIDDQPSSTVPPITSVRVTTPIPAVKPDTEQNDIQTYQQQIIQPTDESQSIKEELKFPQLDLEAQRQRQRRARRGPTSSPLPISSPQARLPSHVVSRTGAKRNREEYEDGQVSDHDMRIDTPDIVEGQEGDQMSPARQAIHGPKPAETDTNAEKSEGEEEEEGEIALEREHEDEEINISTKNGKTRRHRGTKITTDSTRKQVSPTPPTESTTNTPLVNNVQHPKALGKWSNYTNYKDSHGYAFGPAKTSFITRKPTLSSETQQPPPQTTTATAITSPTTTTTPTTPTTTKRHPKIGINHMDLLYKTEKEVMVCRICLSLEQNPDITTAERRKAKANTKKFPLNASWADLINHCQTEHTKACEDMEKLSPSQIAEMKQRMPPAASMR